MRVETEASRIDSSRSNDGFAMTFILVALATSVLTIAQWDIYALPLFPLIEMVLVALAAFAFRLRKTPEPTNGLPSGATTIFLFGMFCSAFLMDFVTRTCFQHGDPVEIQLTYALRNMMFGMLAVRSRIAIQMATITSLFLVVYSFLITFHAGTTIVVVVYTIFGLWWLIGSHWARIRAKFPDESRTEIPRSAGIVAVCLATCLLVIVGFALGNDQTTNALAGFFPSSGGDQRSDPFARSGVGDGEQTVAGEDPRSFGPIESGLFLESQLPSLYDMYNEFYDDSNKKRKGSRRAIPLAPGDSRQNHEIKAKNKKVSREFSAVRKKSKRKQHRHLRDTESRAMLYVLGRVPLHLKLHVFDHWDGQSLTYQGAAETRPLRLETEREKPWVRWDFIDRQLFSYPERHQLKFINLKEYRVPSPPALTGVHIDRLHTEGLFSWCDDGCLRYGGDQIPPMTVLHIESRRATKDSLEQATIRMEETRIETTERTDDIAADETTTENTSDASQLVGESLGAVPAETTAAPSEAISLGPSAVFDGWRDDSLDDWQQIEFVCEQIRQRCELDPSAVVPPDADDAVEYFLLESKRGPDYLFAVTAAIALRHLGYDTQVVSGLYARADAFDRKANATAVYDKDIHFWTEVRTPSGEWVTVDPSPGYPVLLAPDPWYQPVITFFQAVLRFAARHWIFATIVVAIAIAAFLLRLRITSFIQSWRWQLSPTNDPRSFVLRSLKLLQLRARLHGNPKTPSQTVESWLRNCQCSQAFLLLSQWALYAQGGSPPAIGSQQVGQICRVDVKSISAKLQLDTKNEKAHERGRNERR